MVSEKKTPDCTSCTIRMMSAFCVLRTDEVEAVNLVKQYTFYKKGKNIFTEGAIPHGIYCVHNGKIKISQTGIDGREQILHLAKIGDFMGYRALLGSDRLSCTATALEDSEVCFIPKNMFFGLIEKNPKLALQFMSIFSNMLKGLEHNIVTLSQRPVRERIAQCLLLLKANYGTEHDNGPLNISVTREEIANIAGTTRETVIRTLADFQEENILQLSGKKIVILDHKALINTANLTD